MEAGGEIAILEAQKLAAVQIEDVAPQPTEHNSRRLMLL